MTPLCELARKHQTDKGGDHFMYGGEPTDTCHNYTPKYWELFKRRQLDVSSVLEIGVNKGCSLRMWAEFFPAAHILGLDIDKNTLFNDGRISCKWADQGDTYSLIAAVTESKLWPFDLIVDDGSHQYDHQIKSMLALLPYLGSNGYYIIEDLEIDCRPDIIGRHVPHKFNWQAIPAPGGKGKGGHCPCVWCNGLGPEQLLVIYRDE